MGGNGSVDKARAVNRAAEREREGSAMWGVEVKEGRGQDHGPSDSWQYGKDAAGWTIVSQGIWEVEE